MLEHWLKLSPMLQSTIQDHRSADSLLHDGGRMESEIQSEFVSNI